MNQKKTRSSSSIIYTASDRTKRIMASLKLNNDVFDEMVSSKSVKLKKGYDKRKKVGLPRKLDDKKRTLEWDRSRNQAHEDMPSQIKHGIEKNTDDKEYDTKRSMICKICFNADFNTVFLDCGHSVACTVCAEKVPCCPICRKDIKRVIRIFTS